MLLPDTTCCLQQVHKGVFTTHPCIYVLMWGTLLKHSLPKWENKLYSYLEFVSFLLTHWWI